MELTMRLPKATKSSRIGSAAMRAAAISPAQSGAACGEDCLNTPRPRVSGCTSWELVTSSGQK